VPGGVSYTISVSAYGVTNTTTVTPAVGTVMSVRAVVPISGYIIFGAFVPLSTLILVAVIILVVIIIIVVLLMEYSNWRRRRLAGGLFGPGAK
jgi:Na+/glutamate symporter